MPHFEKTQTKQGCFPESKRTYKDIINYLDTHWSTSNNTVMHQLDSLIGTISQKLSSIIIAGTNGKSTTIYYISQLFCAEKIKVGTFSSPHFKNYNERIAINNQPICNDTFTKLANKILDLIAIHNIAASSKEILTAISLLYFEQNKVDIAVFEQEKYESYDPVTICTPRIIGITRIVCETEKHASIIQNSLVKNIQDHTYVIAADQSKIMLQSLATKVKEHNGNWIMPIRKVAPLSYPYEQLHGRCAALAERIIQTYMQHVIKKDCTTSNLLSISKKQRGRPRLTSTKKPVSQQTLMENFWKTINPSISNHFQIIQNKKSTILLDNATNIDAFTNLLLGIRLLNYNKPFKNIFFIIGCYKNQFDTKIFIKTLRYFLKKNSAQLAFCPAATTIGEQIGVTWDSKKIALNMQNTKIKAYHFSSFNKAYNTYIKQLNDPQDLLVITGSQAIISEYWKMISK